MNHEPLEGGANFVVGFRPELWRDISVGFGAFPIHGLSVKEVMASIDAALYGTKRDGRDRVVVAEMVTTTDIKLAAAASSASEVGSQLGLLKAPWTPPPSSSSDSDRKRCEVSGEGDG